MWIVCVCAHFYAAHASFLIQNVQKCESMHFSACSIQQRRTVGHKNSNVEIVELVVAEL
jgi:hypothetical protein